MKIEDLKITKYATNVEKKMDIKTEDRRLKMKFIF